MQSKLRTTDVLKMRRTVEEKIKSASYNKTLENKTSGWSVEEMFLISTEWQVQTGRTTK